MKEDNKSEMRGFHNCFRSLQRGVINFWPQCTSSFCKMALGVVLFVCLTLSEHDTLLIKLQRC